MRLRKLLLATSAIVAAGGMAIAPSAMASPNTVTVGANTTGDHTINLTMRSASVVIKIYGVTTYITCSAGSALGVAHAGTGLDHWATITSISMACSSIFPGTTVTMSATCGIDLDAASGYTSGVADSAVIGKARFTNGTDCVSVSISSGCTFTIGSYSTISFNENATTIGGVNYQYLTLSGATPTVHNVTGCVGSVVNNLTFTANAVFGIQSPNGLMNVS